MQNWISLLAEFKQKQIPVALVTVNKSLGSIPCVVGSRLNLRIDKDMYGTIGEMKLEFVSVNEVITS